MNAHPSLAKPFLGSQHDLARCVKTHLFLIGPNNSGSTFATRAIETCAEVWRLEREGQHMLGYQGPDLLKGDKALIWGALSSDLETLRDPAQYDWAKTRQAWFFQASADKADASVFLTKAPPFLVVVDQLARAFENTRFLFLVRNPYAVVEAICRYKGGAFSTREEALDTACDHILNCLQIQRENIDSFADIGVFFAYEELCADPADVAGRVAGLVPELSDLNFDQTLAVKGQYNEPLRNMNDDQIGRLSAPDIKRITGHFAEHEGLLASFGYELL